jgi:hypothetical protein
MDPIGALAITATVGVCSLFFLAWLVMYPEQVAQFFIEEWRDRK